MIEHSHLKIIQALQANGTLTEAANALCLSQPALSHQIGYLEKKKFLNTKKLDNIFQLAYCDLSKKNCLNFRMKLFEIVVMIICTAIFLAT